MSVIQYKEAINFTQIGNIPLQDSNLRMAEKGLLTYLFSKPEGWDFSFSRIALECKDHQDTIRKMLITLEENHYLIREKKPTGKVDYLLFFNPETCKAYIENPNIGSLEPSLEKANKAKSQQGKNQTLSNTNSLSNTKKRNNTYIPKKPKKRKMDWDSLSEKRKTEIKTEIKKIEEPDLLSFEEFVLQLQAKGYQYINFVAAYRQWLNKRKRDIKAQTAKADFVPATRAMPVESDIKEGDKIRIKGKDGIFEVKYTYNNEIYLVEPHGVMVTRNRVELANG